jgi:hypothetical protein
VRAKEGRVEKVDRSEPHHVRGRHRMLDTLTKEAWWYEDDRGIWVYARDNSGAFTGVRLLWSALLAAVCRSVIYGSRATRAQGSD